MKRLLHLAVLLLLPSTASAQAPPELRCPGDNTMEMRECAGLSWEESMEQLRGQLPHPLIQQWQATTRAVCTHAFAAYKDGTIYPQLVVGCGDHLNRALLKQFAPLNSQGDREKTP